MDRDGVFNLIILFVVVIVSEHVDTDDDVTNFVQNNRLIIKNFMIFIIQNIYV